eukprot:14616588-Alexandrium_andersonii.AAC.1
MCPPHRSRAGPSGSGAGGDQGHHAELRAHASVPPAWRGLPGERRAPRLARRWPPARAALRGP